MDLRETMIKLAKLLAAQKWEQLHKQALAATKEHPKEADLAAYVSHALRHLNRLEESWEWAVRATKIDPNNLFAINRVSLLGNLTGRFQEAWDVAMPVLDREPENANDVQNLATTIVNAIHAASKLGRIHEAVTLLTPVVERLGHTDLFFNTACMYSLADDDRIWRYMAKALAAGKPKTAFADGDFDAQRANPRFVALLARDWDAETAALKRSNKKAREALVPEDFIDHKKLDEGVANTERHEDLEAAIDANIDDVESYAVYCDWFQGRGNPRGDFMLASRRCEQARDEDERMLAFVDWAAKLHTLGGALIGPLAEWQHCRTKWRHGFVRELYFDTGYADNGNAGELLASVLVLPAFRFLRSLSIGDVFAKEEMNYDSVVEALAKFELPHLRSLAIGPSDYQMSWTHLHVPELHYPKLESLVLGGGNITIETLELPELRRFAIQTGGLGRGEFNAICKADWPLLDDLEIWFGDQEYGADEYEGSDLAPILAKRSLRRLALKNADFTDQICVALVQSRILPQLTELDLTMGTMTDEGANLILENAQHFGHLKLCLEQNAISEPTAAFLQRTLPNVDLGKQKTEPYVSVGE